MNAQTRRALWVSGLAACVLVLSWLATSREDANQAPASGNARAGADTAPTFELPVSPEQALGAVPIAVAAEAPPAAGMQPSAEVPAGVVREIVLRVVDRAGQPLPTARIDIWRGLAESSEVTRAADESWPVDSSARFALPIGDEHFVLEATEPVAGRSGLWNDRNLLDRSRNVALLTLRLQPPTHLVGRVVTADDEPLPFATVHVQGGGGLQRGQPREAPSSCDGAGRFDVECDTGRYVSLWATDEHDIMSDGEPMPTPRVEVTIGDDPPPEVTLRFPPRLVVEGRLIDAVSGEGLKGQVAVWRPEEATKDEPDWGMVVTEKDGHFSIRLFSAGAQVLRGYAYAGGASVPREIVLPEEGDTVVVDLPVDAPLSIEGRVVDVSGQAVGDAQVWANWYSKLGQSANANTRSLADGTFVLTPRDPHGLYDIGAGYPEVNLAQRFLEAVPAGTRGLQLVLPLRPHMVAVRGRILAADTREPAAGVKAILWKHLAQGGSVGQFVVVDADGGFNAPDVPEGTTVSVQAQATDYGRSLSARIVAGDDAPPLELWLEHRGALAVRARDAQGRPLVSAELRVEAPEGMQGHDSWRLTTDEQGVARLADLDAGTYVISLRDASPPVEARADVLRGRETAVDLVLAPGPP